ncbi:MAG: hydroxyacylglutathione hydrolase [Rhodospirillales bacterium]
MSGTAETEAATRLEVIPIPALQTNYIYLLHEPVAGVTAAVDPSVAAPVLAELQRRGWRLDLILNTHHHHDHVGSNLELKARTGCRIVGNAADRARIPGLDDAVADGGEVGVGRARGQAIAVSGHTIGHMVYWFQDAGLLFSGDTLFSLGCGRLFEGSPSQMWASLCRLRALPAETRVFCGHEYTLDNARFCLTIDPDNRALQARAADARRLREAGLPTLPARLGDEAACNVFLRADDPIIQRAAGTPAGDAVAAFAAIRRRKDTF